MIEGFYRRELARLITQQCGVPLRGAEVGVHKGKTSALLLKDFSELTLYMVDSWPDREHQWGALNRVMKYAQRRVYMQGDSVSKARNIEDGSLDFEFIDADHSHVGCLRDMMAYWPKLREGGLFCGHDYHKADCPGVTQAVGEFGEMHGIEFQEVPGNIWWTLKT